MRREGLGELKYWGKGVVLGKGSCEFRDVGV
jgi:hypothetical protein